MAKFSHSFEQLVRDHNYWQVDFDTHERHVPCQGVRYYEGGRIQLFGQVTNQPQTRANMANETGCGFDFLSSCKEVFLPDGEKVPKAWFLIQQNSDVLMDYEHNRILECSGWHNNGGHCTYPHRDAMPVPNKCFTMRRPDPKLAKELLKELDERRFIAHATWKLKGSTHIGRFSGTLETLRDEWDERVQLYIGSRTDAQWKELVKDSCVTMHEVPYLLIDRRYHHD